MPIETPDRRAVLRAAAMASLAGAATLLPVRARAATKMIYVTPFNFSLSYAAVFHAVAGGFFDKEGLDVEVVNGKGAATAAQLVIAQQAQVARTGGANYIVARADANAPLTAIATIAQKSPFYVVSSPKAPIRTAADMKGKTIGVASLGGSMENTLKLMLRREGVGVDTVERVKVADVPASYALIEGGRIGGFLASISSVVKIVAAIPDASLVVVDDGVPGQVYVASPQAITAREEDFVKFLRGVHRAASSILDAKDRKPIIEKIAGKFEIPGVNDMANALIDLEKNAESWVSNGRQNLLRCVPEQWAAGIAAMAEADMIKNRLDPATFYDNRLRDRAVA